jgi:glyoxylase-like metal-dependent hydrolase (beta-lactamase superfamily II)
VNTYSFDVGAIHCTAVKDGDAIYYGDEYVVNAPEAEVTGALARHGHAPDAIPSPYSGLLVDTGATRILIDTGAGDLTPKVGHLGENLHVAGIDPDSIDALIVTHGHPDHLGGNVGADGQPAYPQARLVMGRREWDYWTDETELARLNPLMGEWSRKNLGPLRDRVELVDGDAEIAPGVHVLDSPGHTPGHIAISIRSADQELLYVSDAALHPIHLEHPDWRPVWDQDAVNALASKRRLFDHAAAERALVLAFHFPPFPSLGHVEKHGSGWHWEALTTDLA